ncbi:CRAL/TRIO domain protein [Aspergillus ambiguus]|uniref:CRAL-TRIO domain-containing protein n=1 Tax=Aspergillus ambiguus TaxID=176160 RepID=UPI003CCCE346
MHACSFLPRRLCLSSADLLYQSASSRLIHPTRARILPPLCQRAGTLTLSYPPLRPLSTSPLSSLKEPRKASSFWTITFTLLLIGSGTWLQDKYRKSGIDPQLDSFPPSSPQEDDHSLFLGVIDTLKTMPVEAAPGTVGNLTPDQEAKLQEFWILLFKVCGIKLDGLEANGDAAAAPAAPPSPVEEKKKQPKRRFTLWGRSNDEETDDSASVKSANGVSSSIASLSITDGDDKFGQTKDFQKALVDMKPEEIRTTFWNMVKQDNPDALLLRFLRARKWDVKKALIMLISTIRWRLLEVNIDDDIMRNGEHLAVKQSKSSDPKEKKKGEDFMRQMRMGKSFLHGVDKQGRPICVIRVRLHRAADQSTEALDRFTVYTIESARMMLAPPVETACIIFDMTDFALANMDYHPVKFMIKCFEANYPECLGVVLIHKAPWIFSSIWNIIKGWLDPVVASKIHFTKNYEELQEFIPKNQIMKELEGEENWEYKYVEIQPDENKAIEDSTKRDELVAERQKLAHEMQDATLDWLKAASKKDEEAVKSSSEKRSELIEKLRVQYWETDPYVRGRSLYDRLNVIQGGGKIEFYPKDAMETGNAAANGAEGKNGAAKAE